MLHIQVVFWERGREKGQCYKMWVLQEPPMSELGWKAVLHLAWPEAEGLMQSKMENTGLKLVPD